MIGIVFEGISSILILLWGQFLLQNISMHLGSRQGILEFKVHSEIQSSFVLQVA